MPIIKSAIKRNKQNEKRRLRNKSVKTRIKTETKRFLSLLGDREKAEEQLKLVYSLYDKAVKKGIIHKNTASRKKSRLAKMIKTQGQVQAQES